MTTDPYLASYDAQLRSDAETPSALSVTRLGPLRLVTFAGGRGFVTYRDLADVDGVGGSDVHGLVGAALDHYLADPGITRVEWKTRGHDLAPGLAEALLAHGFVADEPEAIVIGEASVVATDRRPPAGVALRTVTAEDDVRAMSALADHVFGDPVSEDMAQALLRRLARDDGMELWVAESDGEMVGAGRLEPVAGTEFAGVWGGVVLESWRGRGIYLALTAARAHSALRHGKRLLHSDSTEYSRPILERAGMRSVSTTTPYRWTR